MKQTELNTPRLVPNVEKYGHFYRFIGKFKNRILAGNIYSNLVCFFVYWLSKIDNVRNSIYTGDFFEEWNEITPEIHIRKFEEQTA